MRFISSEINGVTTLLVKMEVPIEQEETIRIRFPEALKRLKELTEAMR